jgi:hypothetical protein
MAQELLPQLWFISVFILEIGACQEENERQHLIKGHISGLSARLTQKATSGCSFSKCDVRASISTRPKMLSPPEYCKDALFIYPEKRCCCESASLKGISIEATFPFLKHVPNENDVFSLALRSLLFAQYFTSLSMFFWQTHLPFDVSCRRMSNAARPDSKGTPSFSLEMKNGKLLILWAHVSSVQKRVFTHLKLIIVARALLSKVNKGGQRAGGRTAVLPAHLDLAMRAAGKIIPAINTRLLGQRIHHPSAQLQSSRVDNDSVLFILKRRSKVGK